MFGIFKSKYNLINSGLMKGMTDIHSHVLPGVDDGSPDINTSLSLLRYMESIGLREVWLTPHIMEDYPTLNKKLQQQFDVLKAAYSGPLNLRLSSEYMMDAAFTNKLDGEGLPLGSLQQGLRQGDPLCHRPAPPRRHCRVLVRPLQGQARAGLGGAVRHRGDVRPQLELAEPQPGWV